MCIRDSSVTIPLGTLTDDRIEIGTEALDEETGTHFGKAEDTVIIVDTVSYEGLEKGKEYKLIGTLMDKEAGEPIKQDGKAVTSETTFVARDESGKVSVEFEVEGKLLRGKAVVAFEKLDVYKRQVYSVPRTDTANEADVGKWKTDRGSASCHHAGRKAESERTACFKRQ